MAVVGVGNELRGDDGVGVYIARRLQTLPERADWLMLNAGPVPERCSGPLRRFCPDLVVLVDAVRMAAPPGTLRWFDTWESHDNGTLTHGLPLDLVATYLESELGCSVALLGIQPVADDVGAVLSAPVRRAALAVVRAFTRHYVCGFDRHVRTTRHIKLQDVLPRQ